MLYLCAMRVSVVNYLNSKPFIYGLRNSPIINEIDLQLDIPSTCADKLIAGEVEIGLVPVTTLSELTEPHIISNYCIGADGEVASVLLLSEQPIEKIKTVFLDYQSRTSVMLAEILFEKWWKHAPQFVDAGKDFENEMSGTTAAVVIGDRAMKLRKKFKYVYDLATVWKKFTTLPFVFACWVANRKLPDDFVNRFNKALGEGIKNKLLVAEQEKLNYPETDINDYFTNKISYNFDERKKAAMQLFLSFVSERLEKEVMKIV